LISSSLEVHNEAAGDLRAILAVDRQAGARLAALLQQLQADPRLQDALLTKDFGSPPARPISAKVWGSVARLERLPIWRLRAWELDRHGLRYRLFYVFDYKRRAFVVIGITQRDNFNYDDPQNPLRVRMVRCVRRDYPQA